MAGRSGAQVATNWRHRRLLHEKIYQIKIKIIISPRNPGMQPTLTVYAQKRQSLWILSQKRRIASYRPSLEALKKFGQASAFCVQPTVVIRITNDPCGQEQRTACPR